MELQKQGNEEKATRSQYFLTITLANDNVNKLWPGAPSEHLHVLMCPSLRMTGSDAHALRDLQCSLELICSHSMFVDPIKDRA